MKYFALILFLFSAIILNAQMSMEEVSYIPSPSGYYNNLIVKGNVNINEIQTRPFNIHSYASFLDLEIKDTSGTLDPAPKIYINYLQVSTGTVSLLPSSDTTITSSANIYINGGNLSIAKNGSNNANLNIQSINFGTGNNATLNVKTKYLNFDKNIIGQDFWVDNIYIMGMKVPACHEYYWQPVSIGNTTYVVLACKTDNNCTIAQQQQEEICLRKNDTASYGTEENPQFKWNTTNFPCQCEDTYKGQQEQID